MPSNKVKREKLPDFLQQVADYIESIGGRAVVVGGIRIAQRPPLKFNYTLEIDFTGHAPQRLKVRRNEHI